MITQLQEIYKRLSQIEARLDLIELALYNDSKDDLAVINEDEADEEQ